jgi:HTH-type transcriptional regulator/antitoxin HigA
MNEKLFQPDWMSAPGTTIADLLEQQNISPEQFAKITGYSRERVSRLLSGRTAITIDVAKLLEKIIGGSVNFWMSREDQYRNDVARLQSEGRPHAAKAWLGELPLQDMIRFGWIKPSGTTFEAKVASCLQFFDVPDVASWRERYNDVLSAVSFRTSLTYESEPGSVLSWLRYGELKCAEIECKNWNEAEFMNALRTIRQLTKNKEPNSFVPALKKICADSGVAVVVLRAPTGCRASGATRFITPKKAMMLLSFRYLSDDQFWFTFFHEAAHLLLHSHKALFLEDGSDATSKEEDAANAFAENILVPKDVRKELLTMPLTQTDIMRMAVKLGVSRGIVVGQLQHMKRIGPDKFNWLKRRFDRKQLTP